MYYEYYVKHSLMHYDALYLHIHALSSISSDIAYIWYFYYFIQVIGL